MVAEFALGIPHPVLEMGFLPAIAGTAMWSDRLAALWATAFYFVRGEGILYGDLPPFTPSLDEAELTFRHAKSPFSGYLS